MTVIENKLIYKAVTIWKWICGKLGEASSEQAKENLKPLKKCLEKEDSN